MLSVVGLLPVCFYSGTLARLAGVPAAFLKPTSNSISVLAIIMMYVKRWRSL